MPTNQVLLRIATERLLVKPTAFDLREILLLRAAIFLASSDVRMTCPYQYKFNQKEM